MKKKLLATLIAVITVIACALGITACGGRDGGVPERSALEKAFTEYYKVQNFKATVTDSRVQKYGYDYSATVEVDYAHKTAHTETPGTYSENYYEISGTEENPHFTIYDHYKTANWSKISRDDLFNNKPEGQTKSEFELHLLNNWVESYLPPFALRDTCYRESAEDKGNWVSLESFAIQGKFSQSGDKYTASVYFCINNEGQYVPYACTASIKLDAQGRFENCVLDFGSNGKITAAYTYGTANVTVPAEVKNAN